MYTAPPCHFSAGSCLSATGSVANSTRLDSCVAVDEYECICEAGWSGAVCDENVDDCAAGPCENGGTCTDAIDGYSCLCAQGWEGAECRDRTDMCADGLHTCHSMASCENTVVAGMFQCDCLPGFMGDAQLGGSGCVDIDEW